MSLLGYLSAVYLPFRSASTNISGLWAHMDRNSENKLMKHSPTALKDLIFIITYIFTGILSTKVLVKVDTWNVVVRLPFNPCPQLSDPKMVTAAGPRTALSLPTLAVSCIPAIMRGFTRVLFKGRGSTFFRAALHNELVSLCHWKLWFGEPGKNLFLYRKIRYLSFFN